MGVFGGIIGIISEGRLEGVWDLFDGILERESIEITEGILWSVFDEVLEELLFNCELIIISEGSREEIES